MTNARKMGDALLSHWWSASMESVAKALGADARNGLSMADVQSNRNMFGANTLVELKPTGIIELVFEGIRQPMMLLLLTIAGLSFLFGRPVEAMVMIFVVAAYVLVEFVNKFRADRTMTRLRELIRPSTKVIRDGSPRMIPTEDVVVGDIVILSPGSRVPADARLLESGSLVVDESPLTGESLPARKDARALVKEDAPLAERTNSVFSGTAVLDGQGTAVVTVVGERSELGQIAMEVQAVRKERTAIQEAMVRLVKALAALAVILSLMVPVLGFLRGLDPQEMIITWLALTFLMVPGQPPVIITMALALASFELSRVNVVVRRLHGVETLGQVTSIITDKTGTITENKMKVAKWISPDGAQVESPGDDLRQQILLSLPRYSNDPTDSAIRGALQGPSSDGGGPTPVVFRGFSEHPWRALIYDFGNEHPCFIAGSPEALITASTLSSGEKVRLADLMAREAGLGRRVVAFASREAEMGTFEQLEGVRLLSLAVLEDSVRPSVREAISTLDAAGIKTFILTGDLPETAVAVAEDVGIRTGLITGKELDEMDERSLQEALPSHHLLARVTPTQKLRVLRALQGGEEVVGVIGDGLNDAPAIRAADVGIAMGEIGTDLAKEASDLLLADDDYAHISDAVGIGRRALDNFRKGLTYYLTAKAILFTIFVVPLALGIPFPFAPIHIILTELLMDLASSTIFVTERAEPDVLRRRPQRFSGFLDRKIALRMSYYGVGLIIGISAIYLGLYYGTGNVVLAQTAAFTTWLLGHISLALNLKQEKMPLLEQGIFSNRFGAFWLLGMIVLSLSLTSVSTLFPYFRTTSLPLSVWVVIILVVLVSTYWIEVKKLLLRFTERGSDKR